MILRVILKKSNWLSAGVYVDYGSRGGIDKRTDSPLNTADMLQIIG